jgi:hypothetical protein
MAIDYAQETLTIPRNLILTDNPTTGNVVGATYPA